MFSGGAILTGRHFEFGKFSNIPNFAKEAEMEVETEIQVKYGVRGRMMNDNFVCQECGHDLPVAYQCDAGKQACVLCCMCYPGCGEDDE